MADWTGNVIWEWAGTKVSDHGRAALSMSTQRIGADKRTADGTLRRFFIKNKRTWTTSWSMLPSTSVAGGIKPADGGMSGTAMENFYNANPGKFRMVIRDGSAIGLATPNPAESALPYDDGNFYIANVMITEFSKEVTKRGPKADLWTVNVTLEEV